MKMLFTSDLHLHPDTVNGVLSALRKKIAKSNPDVLVISGDVSDAPKRNTFDFFSEFDLPVVFCLGNHEYAYSSVEKTLAKYAHDYEQCVARGVKSVHCLDTEGHFDTHGVRFYGNVLWYDGSLYNGYNRKYYIDKVYRGWLDASITDFKPIEENAKCVERIKHSQDAAAGKKLVLVTHCVPHRKLNLFDIDEPFSIPNCYSGVANLFDSCHIYPDVALCGHTHRRVLYEHKAENGKSIFCYNSGNDYFFDTGEVVFDEIEI